MDPATLPVVSENPDNPVLVPHPLDRPPIPVHLYRIALRHAAARMDAEQNGNEETWFSVFGDTLRDWADEA